MRLVTAATAAAEAHLMTAACGSISSSALHHRPNQPYYYGEHTSLRRHRLQHLQVSSFFYCREAGRGGEQGGGRASKQQHPYYLSIIPANAARAPLLSRFIHTRASRGCIARQSGGAEHRRCHNSRHVTAPVGQSSLGGFSCIPFGKTGAVSQ